MKRQRHGKMKNGDRKIKTDEVAVMQRKEANDR